MNDLIEALYNINELAKFGTTNLDADCFKTLVQIWDISDSIIQEVGWMDCEKIVEDNTKDPVSKDA